MSVAARWILWGAVATAVAGSGCGSSSSATSGTVLEMVDADERAALEADAPAAYARAAKYAALADESAAEGDDAAAARFTYLSKHALRMARLHAEKKRFRIRLAAEEERARQLDADIENTQLALQQRDAETARRQLRRHVARVVSETRRRAAEEESARIMGYTGRDKRAHARAREAVARAMIARARVWSDTLACFVPKNVDVADYLASVDGPIAAAEASLEDVDPATVQKYVEIAGAAFEAEWARMWAESALSAVEAVDRLEASIATRGIDGAMADFAVLLTLNENAETLFPKLAEVAMQHPTAQLLLLAPWRENRGDPISSSAALAERLASRMIESGIPKDRVHHRGTGRDIPLAALKNSDAVAALLLIPGPIPE